jgi:hypothetical protein
MAPSWRSAAPVTVRPIVHRGTAGRAGHSLGLLSQRSWRQRRRARLHLPPRGGRRVGRPHRRRRPRPPVGHSRGAVYALLAATQASSLRSLVLYELPLIDHLDVSFIDGLAAVPRRPMPHRPPSRFHTLADGPPDVGVPSSGDPGPIPATRRRRTSMAAAGCVAQVTWRGAWRCRSSCGG